MDGLIAKGAKALIVLALGVWATTAGGANRVGWWTFLTLWLMRQSRRVGACRSGLPPAREHNAT